MPARKDDVLSVLRDPRTSLIDFHLAHFHVSGAGYELVAGAIEAGKITVEVGESTEWAAYSFADNTLYTRRSPILNNAEQALIVHECTHALLDLKNAWKFTDLSSEAAAYLAQTVFRYLGQWQRSTYNHSQAYLDMFHYTCALVEKYKLHRPAGRGTRLAWEDYRRLRWLIQQIPAYSEVKWLERAGADGV